MQDRLGRGVLRRPRRVSVTGSDENEQALSTLMARYQAGEVEAFEELYRRTRAPAPALARSGTRGAGCRAHCEPRFLLDSAILTQALERIPERYREPVVLHHLFGLSFRDIAGMVGRSEGGARVRASRGMAALRQILGRSVKLPAAQKSDD
jgi:DNA-directed RNA polymerase specialized sigma24 family protein